MRSKLTSEVKVRVKFTGRPSAARQDGATRATPGRWSSISYKKLFGIFRKPCFRVNRNSWQRQALRERLLNNIFLRSLIKLDFCRNVGT